MNICLESRKFNYLSIRLPVFSALAPSRIGDNQLTQEGAVILVHGLDGEGEASKAFPKEFIRNMSFPQRDKDHEHAPLGMG